MKHKVTLIPGDGIGPEVTAAMVKVVDASGAEIEWDEQLLGEAALEETGDPFPFATLESIRDNKVAIKGPTATPAGEGHRSLNVRLRETFKLYAGVRPVRTMPGIKNRFSDTSVDIVLFRENLEDGYIGEEREITGGALAVSRFTDIGCERIARYAFEYARRNGRKKITVVMKANIFKLTHGLFRKWAFEVAKEYPQITLNEYLFDVYLARLVHDPSQFDCVLMTNVYGDGVSDLHGEIIGGLGFAPGANIGDECAIFEAVHGSAPDIAGKGIANPSALILSAALMLHHLGRPDAALRIRNAVDLTLTDGKFTRDVVSKDFLSTKEFTNAVISNL